MTIKVGDKIPAGTLTKMGADGPQPVTTERGDFHFDDPEWSPDGDYVLVRRNEAGSPNAGQTPWLIHLDGGRGVERDERRRARRRRRG